MNRSELRDGRFGVRWDAYETRVWVTGDLTLEELRWLVAQASHALRDREAVPAAERPDEGPPMCLRDWRVTVCMSARCDADLRVPAPLVGGVVRCPACGTLAILIDVEPEHYVRVRSLTAAEETDPRRAELARLSVDATVVSK